jgi:hypothetical protein
MAVALQRNHILGSCNGAYEPVRRTKLVVGVRALLCINREWDGHNIWQLKQRGDMQLGTIWFFFVAGFPFRTFLNKCEIVLNRLQNHIFLIVLVLHLTCKLASLPQPEYNRKNNSSFIQIIFTNHSICDRNIALPPQAPVEIKAKP